MQLESWFVRKYIFLKQVMHYRANRCALLMLLQGLHRENNEEPGKAMPRASAMLAIVLVIYILHMFLWMRGFWVCRSRHRTYTSASSRTRTDMSYCIISFVFRLQSFTVLKVFAIWLEGRYDVKLWHSFTWAAWMEPLYAIKPGQFRPPTIIQFEIDMNRSSNWTDGENRNTLTGHENTWHIFVASGNNYHIVEVMTTCSSLHLICYQVPGLKWVCHSICTHANVIPYVPMLMSLLTPTVPNLYPMISELTREAFTCWPRPRRCLLQLVYLEMELQLGKVKHCIWVSFLPAKKEHIRALEERNRDEKLTIQLLRRPWPCWSHRLSWPHL